MIHIFLALFIGLSGDTQFQPETDEPLAHKSLRTARLFSATIPGAGEFYVHNYWKGVIDFGIESSLVGVTIYSLNERENAPEEEDSMTQEDYTILTCLTGVSALGYYIYQIWKLNDDVVVYNYKLKFLKPTSLELNLSKPLFTLALVKEF